MSFILALIERFGNLILFVLLEVICFVLIVNFNHKQREIFLHSTSLFSGSMLKKSTQLGDYLDLELSNQDLLRENARLLQELINTPKLAIPAADTSVLKYDVSPARVIKNSITSLRNKITIDKGLLDSVTTALGVVDLNGVVGIVRKSNDHFASVMTLLNVDTRISASIEGMEYFGTVTWDGKSYDYLTLSEIPIFAEIKVGDKVITNGYSTIFPKGILIGTVRSFDQSKDGAFYDIYIEPTADLSKLQYVYVLKGNFVDEINALDSDE